MTDRDDHLTALGQRLRELARRVRDGIEVIDLELAFGADGRLAGSAAMFRTEAAALLRIAANLTEQAGILFDVAALVEDD